MGLSGKMSGRQDAESNPEGADVGRKQGGAKRPGLRVAYLLLWFPEPSQTFILEEVNTLVRLGLEVRVYTLYGPRPAARIAGMARVLAPVRHLGTPAAGMLLRDLASLGRDWGPGAGQFLRQVLSRRWRSLEIAGEALWAAAAGVHLAKEFRIAGIGHIHAPWADGPATAAGVASHLSGIPFSFGARAGDLHPPDGALLKSWQRPAWCAPTPGPTNATWPHWRPGRQPRSSIFTTASLWSRSRPRRGAGSRPSACWPWGAWSPKKAMRFSWQPAGYWPGRASIFISPWAAMVRSAGNCNA